MAYKLIPGIMSEFKDFVAHFSNSNNKPAIQLTSKQTELVKTLGKHAYFDLAPLYVTVPEGLNVGYRAYCEALETALQFAEILPEELSNYETFISRLLSNEDDVKSTDYAKFKYDTMNKDLDASVAKIARCFKKNDHTTEMKYGQVIQSNGEWSTVFEQVNSIVKRIEAVDRTSLLKQIERTTKLLDMFQGKIKRHEIDNISHEMVAKVGDYTYIVARYLEYYSVTHYRVLALAEAINQTTEKVLAICNRK